MPDHKCSDPICQRLCAAFPDVIDSLRRRKVSSGQVALAEVTRMVVEVLDEFPKDEIIRYTAGIVAHRALNDARRRAHRDSVIGQIVESLADELEKRGQHKRF